MPRLRVVLPLLPLLLFPACSPRQNLASACGYGDPEACTALREARTLPAFRPGAFVPQFQMEDHD
jgi:hypothetical protein